jgi:N-methylhydantoinase A
MSDHELLIGIDVGGTFTDAIVFDRSSGELSAAFKVPSTPGEPGQAVVDAIDRITETIDVSGAVVWSWHYGRNKHAD